MALALLAGAVGLGCQQQAEDLSHASAERIYLVRCSRCHEPDGSSLTASAKTDHDIDFRDPEWQMTFDDAAIRKIATFGQGKMLGVAGITESELDSVIVHVRRIGRAAGATSALPGAP
jgi:mono/diheme cytochrome c family protein